jgi:hydroxyacid-oxoacid transhydrogenase
MNNDIAFEMAVSSVRFGVGVTREVGMDLKELGARLVMVLTDPVVAKLPPVRTAIDSLERSGVAYALYDRVRVEPSDESFLDAIASAKERPFDAFVAVGGGSTIDTRRR